MDKVLGAVDRITVVHDALAAWLHVEYGDEDLTTILAALTFELARLIGVAMKHAAPAEVDAKLTEVDAALRAYVESFRRAGT